MKGASLPGLPNWLIWEVLSGRSLPFLDGWFARERKQKLPDPLKPILRV